MPEMKDNEILAKRIADEKFRIQHRGFAIRCFEENNVTRGSWAYTVGLTHRGVPHCLFARAGISTDILDLILSDVSESVLESGPLLEGFMNVSGLFIDKEEKTLAKLVLQSVPREEMEQIREGAGLFIEGQAPGTQYYMVFMGDKNNRLPGEDGYEDFLQMRDDQASIEAE